MKIKTAILAGILLASLPVAVKAQDIENYEDYQVSCEAGVDCNNFDVIYEQESEDRDEISQRTRTRRTRRTSSFNKYYAGGNVGAFFGGDGTDVGIGFGGLLGYRLTEQVAAELEVYDYFGGTDFDDLGYNLLGIAANATFRYPLSQNNSKSIYAFGGAGAGFGVVSSTGDAVDAAEELAEQLGLEEPDNSESGFLLQGKVGVGYPVAESVDVFGQFRYLNVFVDGDNGDAFTLDAGATFSF